MLKPSLLLSLSLCVGGAFAQDAQTPPETAPEATAAEVEQAEARLQAAKEARDAEQAELDAAQADVAAAEDALVELRPLSLSQGWDFTALVGVNGSSGNTEAFNFRTNVNGSRSTKKLNTTVGFNYNYQNSDGEESADRFVADIANDWLFEDSDWLAFANGRYEYDEFQDWLHRLSGFGGVGYEFMKGPKHNLIGRVGAGGNQTINSSDDKFTPEGYLQVDYTWKISDKQRFRSGATFFPSLEKVSDFRVNSYAEYRITLDQSSNMVLVAGLEDRYDSDPGAGASRNDVDYYLTLGWTF